MGKLVASYATAKEATKYDLIANICHDGKPDKGTYRVHIFHESTDTWSVPRVADTRTRVPCPHLGPALSACKPLSRSPAPDPLMTPQVRVAGPARVVDRDHAAAGRPLGNLHPDLRAPAERELGAHLAPHQAAKAPPPGLHGIRLGRCYMR